MARDFVVYLQVDGDSEDSAARIAEQVSQLEDVEAVDVRVEEAERGGVELLNEVTLTITALGGAASAATILAASLKKLLAELGVRAAWLETDDGMDQLVGNPRNEKPAQ